MIATIPQSIQIKVNSVRATLINGTLKLSKIQ